MSELRPPLSTVSHGHSAAPLRVDVAEMKCAAGPGTSLRTHALGSCIGLTVWDPEARVGGLLHYMLAKPHDKEEAREFPYMYAVSGIPALFRAVSELGAKRERLIACAAGASEFLGEDSSLSIGKRNRAILSKLFIHNCIVLHAEDTGGNQARQMQLDVGTGIVTLRVQNEERVLWRP
ncbi:MAG: chemotaxis protein CheD [Planctomycetes bacterium]|nr:chemotaxis protein CheD [Planctomycetota bacterium]